ncbi:MAG: hypothetical protein JWM11_6080, partial [Planctomycetaceae bacterium]|nr:hypothetical protein [Planctomycetaceae bacterium]
GTGFLFYADRYPASAQNQASSVTKWEYKSIRFPTSHLDAPGEAEIAKLNDMGAEGWEVTASLVPGS